MPYVVHLEVESAGVADCVAVLISSPQRRHVRLAIGARCTCSSRRRLRNVTTLHTQQNPTATPTGSVGRLPPEECPKIVYSLLGSNTHV